MATQKLFFIVVSLSLCLLSIAGATEVSYELEDLGSNQWICRYSVTNDTLGEPVEQFIIWYEPWLYENLTVVSDPEIGYDWYQDTIEPDPIWLYYGAYRALAWDEGIEPGGYESGFAVRFTYLGPGIPGPQEFDIVDPDEYISLEAGWTIPALYVDDDAAGNPIQTGTSEYPFETITLAVAAASDGYLVNVAPGEYSENVNFQGKAITVRSSNPRDWDIINSTIINGRISGSCVVFDSGEGNDSILEGFTLTNGKGQYGIDVGYFSSSSRVGGGILCLDSSPTISRCNITSNAYSYSGECIQEVPRVEYGGGIALIGTCSAVISNCFITDNHAEYGAGIVVRSEYPEDSASSIVNCTIANNLFYYDTPGYQRFEVDCKNTKVMIKNTIIYNQDDLGLITFDTTPITYSCIKDAYYSEAGYFVAVPYDLTAAGGNIDENPKFVSPQQEVLGEIEPCVIDYESDCHLQLSSPCLNAGDPTADYTGQSDIDGYPRLMSSRVDIGADEIIPTIVVEKPTGGEVWAAGSSHPIEWASYGITGNVEVSYSINNGTDWNVIDSNTIDSGSYLWILPVVDSEQCIVSVTATLEPDYIEYVNSGMFTILPYTAGTPVSSKWPTLAKDFDRNALSSEQGPELGCVKWQYLTPAPVYISTTVGANDQIHIACDDGKIYTIDPNGVELWVYELDANSLPASAPSVGLDGTIYAGADNGKLYAIDKDGQLRWTHDTDAFIYSSPAVEDDGKVFVGFADGRLYALGQDGSELWSYEIDGPGQVPASILASPAIGGDGNVYIGGLYDPNLYALDPADGSVVWSCNFEHPADPCDPCSVIISGSLFASPVVAADGTIYAGLLNDTSFYAIDPAAGSILWSTELADTDSGAFDEYYSVPGDPCSVFYNVGDSCWSEPVIGPDGTIYVNLDDPYLRALDPADGSINWISRIGMIGGFSMAVGNDGLIYAASDDGGLHVINTGGEEVARFESTDWLSYPVIAGDGTVLLSDADNTVWAISAEACDSTTADLHRPADLTQDRTVNMPDFVMLAGDWLDCSDPAVFGDCNYTGDELYLTGDVNIDMYINIDDLKIMAQYWLDSE